MTYAKWTFHWWAKGNMDNRQSIAYRQTTRIQSESRLNSSELHSNSKQSIAWSAEEWFALVSAKSCTVAIWARPRRLNKPFTVALVVDWQWLVLIRRYSKIKTGGIPAQASWGWDVDHQRKCIHPKTEHWRINFELSQQFPIGLFPFPSSFAVDLGRFPNPLAFGKSGGDPV